MKILQTQQEIDEFLNQLAIYREYHNLKLSELLPGYYFWNTTGSEKRPDFPTIYFQPKYFP